MDSHDDETDSVPQQGLDTESAVVDPRILEDSRPVTFVPLRRCLLRMSSLGLTLYGSTTGFLCYFAMYAWRKSFKAALYEGEWAGTGMSLKTAFVLFQLMGYLCSKWFAIKYVAEAIKGTVALHLLGIGIIAQVSVVLFAVFPQDWKVLSMFLNGLSLGPVWGLTCSYLEGRKGSDFMLTMLSISFIVSSGIVKDIALALMEMGIDQYWMPSAVGAIFTPLYFVSVFLLHQMPMPSIQEKTEKTNRVSMTHEARLSFYLLLWPGLTALWVGVILLTAYRDYRDTFALEIFIDLGLEVDPGLFSSTELVVGLTVLVPVAALVLVKDNYRAAQISFFYLTLGSFVVLVATVTLSSNKSFNGMVYMILTGVGSYLAYVPYNSVLFERLIALTGVEGTVAFCMSVSDALGYIGVFVLYILAEFGPLSSMDHLSFFQSFGYIMCIACAVVYVLATIYFLKFAPRGQRKREVLPEKSASLNPPQSQASDTIEDVLH